MTILYRQAYCNRWYFFVSFHRVAELRQIQKQYKLTSNYTDFYRVLLIAPNLISYRFFLFSLPIFSTLLCAHFLHFKHFLTFTLFLLLFCHIFIYALFLNFLSHSLRAINRLACRTSFAPMAVYRGCAMALLARPNLYASCKCRRKQTRLPRAGW